VGRLRLVERRLDVAEALTEVGGKVAFGPLKTSESRRTVTVPAFLAEEIAAHVQQYVQHGPDSLVFAAPAGGPIHRSSWRQRFWLPAVRRAGVEPPPTFHHLRHHAAAVAIAAGAHPKAIQARLGHSNVSVTLGTYEGLLPGLDDDLARRLDEARTVAAADSAARLLHENVVPIRR
jgi:integrase